MTDGPTCEVSIDVQGPFSLEQALEFLAGFPPAGLDEQRGEYRAAHLVNGRPLLITVEQPSTHHLRLTIDGRDLKAADNVQATKLVKRIFSLSIDATPFYDRVGTDDPVIGGFQRQFPGLRPVLFGSPFEALCWAIIGQRISIAQAAMAKARLAAAFGPTLDVRGKRWQAFPGPAELLELDPESDAQTLRLPVIKVERLHALAERGIAGDFEADLLLSKTVEEARDWLEQSPGIGPWGSGFTLIRGAGHPDLLPHGERRFTNAVQLAYELDHEPSIQEVETIARRWSGYRSWAAFLLRVSQRRDL